MYSVHDKIMSVQMALCFFVFLIILYNLVQSRRSVANSNCHLKKKAPEPAGAWPIIGHLPLLRGPDLPHKTLACMADKHGPVFMLRTGVRRALVVSSWEVAKECYTTNDQALASRPSSVAVKIMGYNYAMFGFSPYGPYWRQIRKIALHEVLSSARLESLKSVRDFEVGTSIRELYEVWANQNVGNGPVLVDMKHWFGNLTLNLVLRMIAGKSYHSKVSPCDENESRRWQKAMREFMRLLGLFVVEDAIPYLGWLDLQGPRKQMKQTAQELDCIIQGWLEEHQRKKQSGEAKGDDDFIYVMMSILKDANIPDYDADTINKATCLTLISGGSDTTLISLIWALSLLLNNQHALKQAQNELDTHIGKDRKVEESDLKNLVYLQAVIKETMRLYPAGPLSGPRVATEDCTIAGYHVPTGTRLILNLWKLQRDPSVWSDPLEFRPERFLTSHRHVDVRGQNFELLPFGSGRRACPGITLALQMVQLSLARLLHHFELTTPSGAPVDMTESIGQLNIKATTLEVLIKPRLPEGSINADM